MVEAAAERLAKTSVTSAAFSPRELELAARAYGTPLFVIDEPTLRSKVHDLRRAYASYTGESVVAYSIKANFSPAVLRVFISEGILFDVTSLGELSFFTSCGGRPENVIYTSVTEEEPEYEEVLQTGVPRIAVSSHNGLLNLIDAAKRTKTTPHVLIRVNPEVGVKAEVKASYRHGKFGVPFNTATEDSATNILRRIFQTPDVLFDGLHFHLGSQIEDPSCFIHALEKLEHFVTKMRREIPDLHIAVLDIGGGTPVNYGKTVPRPEEIAALIMPQLEQLRATAGDFLLVVESGRYLSAEACVLVSRITNTKVYANQKFVFTDAGYHVLLDAALLHQEYPQQVIPRAATPDAARVLLSGRLCDTYDIFPVSPSSDLAGAEPGKYVVFSNVGAYSIVFNMPFHCQTKPPILMRRVTGDYVVVREAESLEHLFEEEGGNLRLE